MTYVKRRLKSNSINDNHSDSNDGANIDSAARADNLQKYVHLSLHS